VVVAIYKASIFVVAYIWWGSFLGGTATCTREYSPRSLAIHAVRAVHAINSVPPHHRSSYGYAADILDAAESERLNAAEEFELQSLDGADLPYPDQEHLADARRKEKRTEKLARLLEAEEMKFSHSIQFNAVPDWSSHYISYSNLKKL